MVDMLSKGILSRFKDQNSSRFRRDIAANSASNSRLVGVKMKERIQVPVYLLQEAFYQVFSTDIRSKICSTTSRKAAAIKFVARGEDSLTQYIYHFPEKCHANAHFFEKVFSRLGLHMLCSILQNSAIATLPAFSL